MNAGVGWWLAAAVVVVGGLVVGLVVWSVRSRLRERRKARYFAQLSAQYRKEPKALPVAESPPAQEHEPRRMVTVEELVAKLESEGLPTRLNWNGDDDMAGGAGRRPDEDEWPTGVLPHRVP